MGWVSSIIRTINNEIQIYYNQFVYLSFSSFHSFHSFIIKHFVQPKALKPLREAIPNFLIRLNNPSMKAIDTSDISQWFKYNSTYSFLHQMNTSSNVSNSLYI